MSCTFKKAPDDFLAAARHKRNGKKSERGELPTFHTNYVAGNGTNEPPNSLTGGDPGMRQQNRYGKNDRPEPDVFGLG